MSSQDPAEQAERRRQLHGLEAHARHHGPDPARILRVQARDDHPGMHLYLLARWSTAARLIRNATEQGTPSQIADLGPLPWTLDRPGNLHHIGVRHRGRWVRIEPGMEQVAAAALDMERGRN